MYKMKKELTRDMYILLSKFAKENNIKMEDKEFISALKSILINIVHDNTNQTFVRNTNFTQYNSTIYLTIVCKSIYIGNYYFD